MLVFNLNITKNLIGERINSTVMRRAMFKLLYENIYGMMAVSSKALKGNVILIYHNQMRRTFPKPCYFHFLSFQKKDFN